MSRASLTTLLNAKIISGGNKTTAQYVRDFENQIISESVIWADDTDNDGTLAANSPGKIPTQKAVKTYVDSYIASATLNKVLTTGNTTGGQKIIISAGDYIEYTDAIASRVAVYDSSKRFTYSVVTATELTYVSGVTSAIQTQINSKQATITGGATTITSADLGINKALVSSATGKVAVSSVSDTELGYLSGALSNIQNQINNINAGLSWKVAVRVATTANITLSGTQTIDGIAVIAGDRVLVKNQSTGADNGIYVCASGAWARATDATTGGTGSTGVLAMTMVIEEGTVNADVIYTCTTDAPITVGVTTLTFIKTNSTTYTGSNGITLTGNNFTLDNSYFSGDVTVSGGVTTIGANKVLYTMIASMTSAQMAGIISDETGYSAGALLVFSISPAFTGNPTATTQSQGNNSTRIATTAYVDAALDTANQEQDLATQIYHLYLTNR